MPTLAARKKKYQVHYKYVSKEVRKLTPIEEAEKIKDYVEFATIVKNWMNTYKLFKKAEIDRGLPRDEPNKLAYGVIVSQLKSMGKFLKLHLIEIGLEIENLYNFTNDDFFACLEDVCYDDYNNDYPLKAKERRDLAEIIG